MSDWRKWLEEMEERAQLLEREAYTVPDAVEARCMVHSHSLPRLFEGYRLLAEAVEAKADLDAAVDEYVKARKPPLQIDPERTNALGQRGLEMQTRYHQAQAKAVAHLRGVGRDA